MVAHGFPDDRLDDSFTNYRFAVLHFAGAAGRGSATTSIRSPRSRELFDVEFGDTALAVSRTTSR
jgi:hypothetical protein